MTITYVPDWQLAIVDEEGRQTQEFNEWVREVSALLTTPSYVSAYWVGNTDVTDLVTVDVWVDIAGTLVGGPLTTDFSISGNTITWNGSDARTFLLTMTASATDAGVGFDEGYQLGYKIESVTQPVWTVFTAHISNQLAISLNHIVTLQAGQSLTPQFRTTDVVIEDLLAETFNISLTPVG